MQAPPLRPMPATECKITKNFQYHKKFRLYFSKISLLHFTSHLVCTEHYRLFYHGSRKDVCLLSEPPLYIAASTTDENPPEISFKLPEKRQDILFNRSIHLYIYLWIERLNGKPPRIKLHTTSPCKICCEAFQHFLESLVKSVRKLRNKRGI